MKARQIQESVISHAPPCVREIWDYLLRECNHVDRKVGGTIVKRGQCIRTYEDIRQALHWHTGWCKRMYSKNQVEFSMNFLREHTMVNTSKTTRGLIITVEKYDYYQNQANYKQKSEPKLTNADSIQTPDTINKNDKHYNKDISPDNVGTVYWALWKHYQSEYKKVYQQPYPESRGGRTEIKQMSYLYAKYNDACLWAGHSASQGEHCRKVISLFFEHVKIDKWGAKPTNLLNKNDRLQRELTTGDDGVYDPKKKNKGKSKAGTWAD